VIVLRVIVFLLGAALAIWTVLTAITTVVLPRGSRSVINSVVFGSSRVVFGFVAKRRPTYEQEDRVLALHAPFGLVGIVGTWLLLVLVGFMFMFWALEPDIGWSGAFAESGSSITTLGFVAADATAERALAFIEAGVGLLLLTLLITYLPTIYSAFARRETKVTLLEVRAGSPPSAIEFLLRYHRIGWLETLDEEWRQWEAWFADIEESHTSYPSLVFFRSPDPDRSWVTAAGPSSTQLRSMPVPFRAPSGPLRGCASGPATSPCGGSPTSSGSPTTPIRLRTTRSASPGENSMRPSVGSRPAASSSWTTATRRGETSLDGG